MALPKLLRVDVASYYRARWGRQLPSYSLDFLAGAFLGDRSLMPHIYHDIADRYAIYSRTQAPHVLRPILRHNGAKLQLIAALLTWLYRADCPLPRLPWHDHQNRSAETLSLTRQLMLDTGYVLVRPPTPTPVEVTALQQIESDWWSFRWSLEHGRSRREQAIYRYVRPWLVAEGVFYVAVSSVAAVQYLQTQGFEPAVRELLAELGLAGLTLRYVRPRVTDQPQPPRGPYWDVLAWLDELTPQEVPAGPPVVP